MGLDTASIKFCCAAKAMGVDFSRTLMIGRQSMFSNANELGKVFSVLGIDENPQQFLVENKYAEKFFLLLGAKEVTSLDYTDYEGATIIHDMNSPISGPLKNKFSVVYDGGTLEHIFNIPQALKNCMEMIEVGGFFLQANIANNFMGHGFYQFSPELLFRVFSPENGFATKVVLVHERIRDGKWYVVKDPDKAKQRVLLCNSNPTYVLTIAQKTADAEIFKNHPLQSDYVSLWKSPVEQANSYVGSRSSHRRPALTPPRHWLAGFTGRVANMARKRLTRESADDPFDRDYYLSLEECDVLLGRLSWPQGPATGQRNNRINARK